MQEEKQKTMHKTSASPIPWEFFSLKFPKESEMLRVCSMAAVSQAGRPAFVPSLLRGQYQAGEQSMHHNCTLTTLTKKVKLRAKP